MKRNLNKADPPLSPQIAPESGLLRPITPSQSCIVLLVVLSVLSQCRCFFVSLFLPRENDALHEPYSKTSLMWLIRTLNI